jgi:hypothetical protein
MCINKSPTIKGVLCGIILSCLNNLFIILSLYSVPFELISYGIAIISAILAIGFLINEKVFKSACSFFISIILFIITELVFDFAGIVRMVFKHINGVSAEMWDGDGFGMLIVLLFSFVGYFWGSILALILSFFKGRKVKQSLIKS